MERQGHFRGFQIVSGYSFVWVVLVVLLLSVSGWGACSYNSTGHSPYSGNSNPYCKGDPKWGVSFPLCSGTPACAGGVIHSSSYYYVSCWANYSGRNMCSNGSWGTAYAMYSDVFCRYRCGSQSEADSLRCALNPNAEGCADLCEEKRSQCEAASGTFSGGVISANGQTCCSAECNLCSKSAMERRMAQKIALCCSKDMAPPGKERMCQTPTDHAGFKCGMAISQVSDEAYDWSCRDPGLDEENFQSYIENCEGGSSDSQGPGSSASSAGSSGEEGSSGQESQYPEGCDECPWLDSILDTLTEIKSKVDNIELCVTDPLLCNDVPNDETVDSVYIDSTILNGIKELMDSTIELSDEQVRLLMSIDSTVLKMLISDSVTREAIATAVSGGASDIVAGIGSASSNLHGGLVQVRNGIMEMDTAMRRRLDSLLKTIPSDVLDSIVKYQDSVMDRFDSALFGKGVGFSLVDSMMDTVVKYFSVSNHYDSMYNVMFGNVDSTLKSIGDKMDNMSFGIELGDLSFGIDGPIAMEGSGYGDTASTTLREDLNSMKGAITDVINHMDSSVGAEIRNLVNEQKGFYMSATGYGVSGSSTMKGDLQGIKDGIDGISDELGKGSYDTSSVYDGYLGGYDTSAVEFANNLGNLLTGATHDSAYNRIFMFGSSSSGSEYSYGIMNIDSAQQVLQASNDSTKSALADTMRTWFDELRNDFVLVNFDSAIIAPLGAKVPNTNTCPEDCFAIDLSNAGGAFENVKGYNWGLCSARIGSMNVLQFVRLLLRIITAITCIYIGLWFISGRKS